MGIVNKNANLYNANGKLISAAPLVSFYRQESPSSKKYPGITGITKFLKLDEILETEQS